MLSVKLGFIGVGNMAKAIIKGLLNQNVIQATDILVHSYHPANYETFAKETGVIGVDLNQAVIDGADQIVLAVAPKLALQLLQDLNWPTDKIVISLATGVSIQDLQLALSTTENPIVRLMPNVNVEVNQGMMAINENEAGQAVLDQVKPWLEKLGTVMELPEDQFSLFVALAGSSPAFIYLMIDIMAHVGVKYGFNKQQATEIVTQAFIGSGEMLKQTKQEPWTLVDQVSSPGGSTIAGVMAMMNSGLSDAINKGLDATIKQDEGE